MSTEQTSQSAPVDALVTQPALEIRPHSWTERGENYSARFYPFVNGEPCPELADCENCRLYTGAEYCDGWIEEPDNAPMFCGPICDRFDPVPERVQQFAV